MQVFVGADHKGYKLKLKIKNEKLKIGPEEIEMVDLGAHESVPGDNYPKYAAVVAQKVQQDPKKHRGIVICGSGVGVSIVTNRFRQVRCALGLSVEQVRAARSDDDVNVLALAADFVDENTAIAMIKTFLQTPFSGRIRHIRRIRLIEKLSP